MLTHLNWESLASRWRAARLLYVLWDSLWLGYNSNALRYQVASWTHVNRKLSGFPLTSFDYHLYSFPLYCLWLEHTSWSGRQSLFPRVIRRHDSWITSSVSWYSTDNWCRESCPYHNEPILVAFCCFGCLVVFAPLVCFCLLTTLNANDYVTRLLQAWSLESYFGRRICNCQRLEKCLVKPKK